MDVVRCTVEIQERLNSQNSRYIKVKRVLFRIGVNTGDVVQDNDRIYGRE